ncbi:hypothetical protein PRECH8_18610 [Insulibacter thermoxylanivorax]|uniref:Uncharacterized protein n=1 Tax=Insulibacter thermoxylanivorax TaxID=2749268 RepID=A0A916QDL5_9BACL|nr:hypothetical protein PRECH8_18610 [Insulibacter thermoxylanivorax]
MLGLKGCRAPSLVIQAMKADGKRRWVDAGCEDAESFTIQYATRSSRGSCKPGCWLRNVLKEVH